MCPPYWGNPDTNTNPKVTSKYWCLNLMEHFETFIFFKMECASYFLKSWDWLLEAWLLLTIG